ncbi:hypothetical protein CEXT_535861 [Caerostris extrusa]|uniref:Uncharacterized protein n=1 Tax=Caerostris extrusa TaxID=172846 RepID=A0AAV4W2D5_CAEEX|nr:hypothetical protein CEXT_535861 [Caerostris extrusa]
MILQNNYGISKSLSFIIKGVFKWNPHHFKVLFKSGNLFPLKLSPPGLFFRPMSGNPISFILLGLFNPVRSQSASQIQPRDDFGSSSRKTRKRCALTVMK